ncbi:hypothetical protein KP509_1Z310500 [Ceratopteris richardii]|nr:hypothetical protein KP509_1Z310500 [Ceratopteris richardii]
MRYTNLLQLLLWNRQSLPMECRYPQNVQTAKEVESIIVGYGAVPATIAILKGVPCIGLSEDDLEELGRNGSSFTKTARRDISHVVGYSKSILNR